jgi:hypothetical protein
MAGEVEEQAEAQVGGAPADRETRYAPPPRDALIRFVVADLNPRTIALNKPMGTCGGSLDLLHK